MFKQRKAAIIRIRIRKCQTVQGTKGTVCGSLSMFTCCLDEFSRITKLFSARSSTLIEVNFSVKRLQVRRSLRIKISKMYLFEMNNFMFLYDALECRYFCYLLL